MVFIENVNCFFISEYFEYFDEMWTEEGFIGLGEVFDDLRLLLVHEGDDIFSLCVS